MCMLKAYENPTFIVEKVPDDVFLASSYLGDGEKSVSDIDW